MNNDQLYNHLSEIIWQLQQKIDLDISDGTTIPSRYDDIQQLLHQARLFLSAWDTEKVLELIGEINLDTLEEIDEIDDTLWDVLQKLKSLQDTYISHWDVLPQEIIQELHILRKMLEKYDT